MGGRGGGIIIYSPSCHSKPAFLFLAFFPPWNINSPFMRNVLATLFNIMKVNEDQSCQAAI